MTNYQRFEKYLMKAYNAFYVYRTFDMQEWFSIVTEDLDVLETFEYNLEFWRAVNSNEPYAFFHLTETLKRNEKSLAPFQKVNQLETILRINELNGNYAEYVDRIKEKVVELREKYEGTDYWYDREAE